MSEREGVVLAVALGAFHGQMNGVEMAAASIGLTGLLGPVATLFVCVALVSGLVVSLRSTMDPDHGSGRRFLDAGGKTSRSRLDHRRRGAPVRPMEIGPSEPVLPPPRR
jgi:hypothetical protein